MHSFHYDSNVFKLNSRQNNGIKYIYLIFIAYKFITWLILSVL